MIVEVPSRAEALRWAAKLAVACRCKQEVREFQTDSFADADAHRGTGTSGSGE